MSEAVQKETMGFQTEAKQLLHLMINSLYSNKEIFLRELVSNASDAVDKLRFEALNKPDLFENDSNLKVNISCDPEAKTITITDNGIGMNRTEAIEHLGTIAKSGTSSFLESLTGDQQKDSQMIGQFGVGFYSSFIVADRVVVESRRAGDSADQGVRWSCEAEASFDVEDIEKDDRGTSITLHLKKEETEFCNDWKLRSIIKKYSDHIAVPIEMKKYTPPLEEGEEAPAEELEVINSAKAMWTRSRSELSDEDYHEFYKHISHDFQEPLSWSHNRVEGKLDYTSLLYLPSHAPNDLYNREIPRGLKLYIQRTFIMDDAEQFLPLYLRFVKGVIDSVDLPLNVSREILQQTPTVDSIRNAVTKRSLDMIQKLSKEPEAYQKFWDAFGNALKEGPAEDIGNSEKVSGLLRFTSSKGDSEVQSVSLADYISRMKEKQTTIYYLTSDNYQSAKNSSYLEVFNMHGIEVLLLTDRIDEWLMGHLTEFDGKKFQDITRAELDLSQITGESKPEQSEEKSTELTERVKALLADKVENVRTTNRLTESPACLVLNQDEMGMQMRRMLEAAGQEMPDNKPTLEINPDHQFLAKISAETDDAKASELAELLLDQAKLAAGEQLDNPSGFVKRLNRLLFS